jgi:hypothetical protein
MPTIQLEAHLSTDDLLRAADQLPPAELEQFVAKLLTIRAHRQAPCLGRTETELLQRINHSLSETLRSRYAELIDKRNARTLTPEEYTELLRLTDETEAAQADRVRAIVELAAMRKTSFDAILQELGIPGNSHV